jgi:hypothetical protein
MSRARRPTVPQGLLEPVLARRESLRQGLDELERALAAPSRAEGWLAGVRAATAELRASFDIHVKAGEGPEGLTQLMIEAAPRLLGPAQRLAGEHIDLEGMLNALEELVARERPDPQRIRDIGVDVITRLARHRQRGSDLFYEAFQSDLGGSD